MTMEQLPLDPVARASDPDTSHQAVLRGRAGSEALLTAIILAAPRFTESVSAFEIARRVQIAHPGRWDEGSVRTAVSRLGKRGLLVKDGKGKSPRGQACTLYRLP